MLFLISVCSPNSQRRTLTCSFLFERVADSRGWQDGERILLLQSVFVGKVQEAYVSLSKSDCQEYEKFKSVVLRAYKLVPEAYRQCFRNLRRHETQAHVEFVRSLETEFNRWTTSVGVKTFGELANLIILEQLKNCVSHNIDTFINERNPQTPGEAAVLADEYALTHKKNLY